MDLAARPPRCLALAGSSGLLEQLLGTGRKREENIQCTDAGQNPDVMGLVITRAHSSLAKQAGGDKAWRGGEWGGRDPELLGR